MKRRWLPYALGALVAGATIPAHAQPEPRAGDRSGPEADEAPAESPPDPDAEPPLEVDDPEPPVEEPLEATGPDPAPEAAAEPDPEPAPIVGPVVPRSYLEWPRERVLRPRTLPRGTWSLGLELRAELDLGDNLGLDQAAVAAGLAVGPATNGFSFGFGLTDQAELNIAYAFSLRPFEARGLLQVGSGFNLVRDPTIDVSARAGLSWNFAADGFGPLIAGLDTRYLLNARMAILLLPRQLTWTLDAVDAGGGTRKPIYFDVPVGFGLQLTPALYLQLDTVLARWRIRDGDTSLIGADFAPVQTRLFWSPSNQLDLGAGVGADLVPLEDFTATGLVLLLQARYYGMD